MARLRSIKPEFWTSEQVADCSQLARLVFIGMWTFADDNGIHPANPKRLKMEVFPADDTTAEEIAECLAQLVAVGLVREYEAAGTRYWQVTGWHRHQKIDYPTYRHPLPSGEVPVSPSRRQKAKDVSPTSRRQVTDMSPQERKGEERKGEKEKNADDPPAAAHAGKTFDFKAELFQRWKDLPDGGGGAFLAMLFRDYPDQRVVEAVERTLDYVPADPKSFVRGLLREEPKPKLHTPLDDDSYLIALAKQDWAGYLRDDVP